MITIIEKTYTLKMTEREFVTLRMAVSLVDKSKLTADRVVILGEVGEAMWEQETARYEP